MQPTILITRAQPGLGDIIGSSVAMRAAHQKYSPMGFRVVGAFGRTLWRDLWDETQGLCDEIGPVDLCRQSRESLLQRFAQVFSLDGPERHEENTTQWAPRWPRVESWCRSVDHVPADMCPHWRPTKKENKLAIDWLRSNGLEPGGFAVHHFKPDPGLFHKSYRHTVRLARLLSETMPVLVLHKMERHYPPDPDWSAIQAHAVPGRLVVEGELSLRELGAVMSQAACGVGPDSALLHFAAAVDLPWLGLFGPTSGQVTCRHYPLARWLQAPIDPSWQCKNSAPCYGVSERQFWCFTTPALGGECLDRLSPECVADEVGNLLASGGQKHEVRDNHSAAMRNGMSSCASISSTSGSDP